MRALQIDGSGPHSPPPASIRLQHGAFEAVLSRAELMNAIDPLWTLDRLRDALRPVVVTIEMGSIEPPPPGPGPFALGDDGVLERLIRDAGFTETRSGATIAMYEMPSPAARTSWLRDLAPPITELVADQPADVQRQVWQRVTEAWTPFTADGAVRPPCTRVPRRPIRGTSRRRAEAGSPGLLGPTHVCGP